MRTVEDSIISQAETTADYAASKIDGETYKKFMEAPKDDDIFWELRNQLINTLDALEFFMFIR